MPSSNRVGCSNGILTRRFRSGKEHRDACARECRGSARSSCTDRSLSRVTSADAEYRVVGISQGAAIAGDGLADLAHDVDRPSDLAGVLIADPRTPDAGAEVIAPGALPGISPTGTTVVQIG